MKGKKTMMNEKEFYTPIEVGDFLGMPRHDIYDAIDAGCIDAIRGGNAGRGCKIKIPAASMKKLLGTHYGDFVRSVAATESANQAAKAQKFVAMIQARLSVPAGTDVSVKDEQSSSTYNREMAVYFSTAQEDYLQRRALETTAEQSSNCTVQAYIRKLVNADMEAHKEN